MRLTWKKQHDRWGPKTHRLGNPWKAVVQQNKDGTWFWYGGGVNTFDNPTDLETAKKDAAKHIKSLKTECHHQPQIQNQPEQKP